MTRRCCHFELPLISRGRRCHPGAERPSGVVSSAKVKFGGSRTPVVRSRHHLRSLVSPIFAARLSASITRQRGVSTAYSASSTAASANLTANVASFSAMSPPDEHPGAPPEQHTHGTGQDPDQRAHQPTDGDTGAPFRRVAVGEANLAIGRALHDGRAPDARLALELAQRLEPPCCSRGSE